MNMSQLQLTFARPPSPATSERLQQAAAERDLVLEHHRDATDSKAELLRVADSVARELARLLWGVTGPELLHELRCRGYGDLLARVDPRVVGAVLLPSRGFERTGEVRAVGTHARKCPVWRVA